MKAVFFDADGTICDIRQGVPQNTREAIRQLTANGHRAFLCTGRSMAFVPEEILSIGFTGIVAAAGAYLSYGETVLLDREVSCETAERSVKILRKNHIIPVMEGTDHMYYDLDEYTDEVDWFCSLITKTIGSKYAPITGNEASMHINKISAKVRKNSSVQEALAELSPDYDFIIHEEGLAGGTIEMVPKGFSKALGIAVLCGALSIPQDDTVCFGDSNNDLSMFETVACKVAMGNSSEKILALADYVTDNWDQDGIGKALRNLGLI